MRQSELVTKTSREISKEEVSINAKLLGRAGFVNRLMAGVYSFLPLGNRVLSKIENIIRQEMNAINGQEILMPALHPKEIWEQTGRWDTVDVLFRFKGHGERDLALGPTHEEVVTPLVGSFIKSYRDLPVAVFQIQTKFRNEARAKSGLLRGREFRMKDLYSFHRTQEDLDNYYERAVTAYTKVFERCGLGATTLLTAASGGMFSKYSHEFQTVTPNGEDIIFKVPNTNRAINKDIIDDPLSREELIPKNPDGSSVSLEEVKAIEVGNIFKLGTRFSDAFQIKYTDEQGKACPIYMGCYGIGPSRVMGTIVECLHDDKGIVWPDEVAPFKVHLISLARSKEETDQSDEIMQKLHKAGIEVLYDDRADVQAGEKFADCDLIGIPHRVVVSKKTLAAGGIEYKSRAKADSQIMDLNNLLNLLQSH